jgi:hypothetical protein
VSSFLLEKLRQERLAEGEKLAARAPPADMGSSLELGAAPATPARVVSPAEGRRPRSSENCESQQQQQAKKKGLGLKEMEQVSFGRCLSLFPTVFGVLFVPFPRCVANPPPPSPGHVKDA